jgi:hypothetical protein
MFNKLSIVPALMVTFYLAACASVPMASKEADRAAKTFKTDPNKANIYIYRNEGFFGAAVRMLVTIDGEQVGETAGNTYIFRQVDPGWHDIHSPGYKLSINTQAGKNYFIWQEIKAIGTELKQVNEKRGKAGVRECDLVESLWEEQDRITVAEDMTKPQPNKAASNSCEGIQLKLTNSLMQIMILADMTCGPTSADPRACKQREWDGIADDVQSLPESCQARLQKYKPAE